MSPSILPYQTSSHHKLFLLHIIPHSIYTAFLGPIFFFPKLIVFKIELLDLIQPFPILAHFYKETYNKNQIIWSKVSASNPSCVHFTYRMCWSGTFYGSHSYSKIDGQELSIMADSYITALYCYVASRGIFYGVNGKRADVSPNGKQSALPGHTRRVASVIAGCGRPEGLTRLWLEKQE